MSTSAKRLAIVTQDPVNYGGVLRLVEYIYARAIAVGVEPTIVHYGKFSEHPKLSVSPLNLVRGKVVLSPRSETYDFSGMRAIAIGALLPEWEPNRIRGSALWERTLREFDASILVTGSAHTGLPLAKLSKYFVAWVSSTVAGDRSERLKQGRRIGEALERLSLPTIAESERVVLGKAVRILGVSEDTTAQLQKLTRQPVECWPFPVDTSLFSSSEPLSEGPARFTFVGRANDPRKRVDLFLAACDHLRSSRPDFTFIAAIVSSVQPTVRKEYPVELYSTLTTADLIALYRASAAFVLTSEQEGLGIAAMEAMSCGLPVISTRCGGPETFITDNETGFFVGDDPGEIANRMLQLGTDHELRRRMSLASRNKIVEAFSEERWNTRFEKLIESIVRHEV